MADDPKVTEIYRGESREFVPLNELCQAMIRHVGIVAQDNAENLAGYILITVARDGSWQRAHRASSDLGSPIGTRMLAGMGIAAIQNDMIADLAVKEALIRNGFVRPDPPVG